MSAFPAPRHEAPHSPIRVPLIGDHTFTRDGLRVTINFEPDLHVVGEARDGERSLELLARLQADVVTLDIGLAGIDEIETAGRIKALSTSEPQPVEGKPGEVKGELNDHALKVHGFESD